MEILTTAGYIGLCILLFSLAIAVHEFGHFIVALKLGLNVERFSLGFGPAIWKKKWRGVEYRISWIPLGGYVSIPDVDPEGTKALEGEKGTGNGERAKKIPAWKELLVAVAGPAMNLVLAAVIAVWLSLVPSARFSEPTMEVGALVAGGAADVAGLRIGDTVKSVNGRPVSNWIELCLEAQYSKGKAVELTVVRPLRKELSLEIAAVKDVYGDSYAIGAYSAGVVYGDDLMPWLGKMAEGSPAEKAGLVPGDRVVSVDGAPVVTWKAFREAVVASEGRPAKLVVSRRAEGEGETLAISVTPVTNAYDILTIDATPAISGAASWMPGRSPLAQLKYDAGQIFYVLKRLCTDTKETSKQLGGPLMIAEQIYANIRHDFWDGMGFLRFLNVNLAVLNLLPIPVLDGGLIMFALIALVFRRRVPEKVVGALSMGFMWLLLAGMAVLFYRDGVRSYRMRKVARERAAEERSVDNDAHESTDEAAEGR